MSNENLIRTLTDEEWNQFKQVLELFVSDISWRKKFIKNPVLTLSDFPNITDAYEVFKALGAIMEMVPSVEIMDKNPYYLEYLQRKKILDEYFSVFNQKENYKDKKFFDWIQIIRQRSRLQGWNDKRRGNIQILPVVFESDTDEQPTSNFEQEIFKIAREELGNCASEKKIYFKYLQTMTKIGYIENSCLAGFLINLTQCNITFVEPEFNDDKIFMNQKEIQNFHSTAEFLKNLREISSRQVKNILPKTTLLTFNPRIKIFQCGGNIYFSGEGVHYSSKSNFIFEKAVEQLQERPRTFEELDKTSGNNIFFGSMLEEKFQFLYEKGCLYELGTIEK